ncbi:hypothetical protein CLV92_108181 [Kineococcus xinjiangensis]|uniref:Uncharacterized protein n=1 Tax=Kineococcus xinjiangensis TaxID=512762 RepID=A0A2S6IJA6_9ACTN|nr:hypothetical protein [Kineococcus xinjiangensis]PPK94278.1 hypothetical protein CLV92_108181 [Kineococcus xinjiangensis]
MDPRAQAARNNAAWCDAVCRSHGLQPRLGHRAWTSAVRTPPLHPDAVTLVPGAPAEDVLARLDTGSPGCSVKDSFADLHLAPAGFRMLFEAAWIRRGPGRVGGPAAEPVRDAGELLEWVDAWSGGGDEPHPFSPALLHEPGVTVLAVREGGRVVAGGVLNLAAGAIGLSNVFAVEGTPPGAAWSGCTAAAAALQPGTPLVGYEHGDDLATALEHGFEPLGPLRVWLARR